MKPIVVIILTLNQRDRTLACLSSLVTGDEPPIQVLVWDNGSTDGTANSIAEMFPQVTVHAYPSNLGVASGRNAAAKLALEIFRPKYLLFLDNDMLLDPNFVGALLPPFFKDDRVGQTQSKLRFMDDRSRINDGGGAKINFISWQVTPVGCGEIDRGQHDTIKSSISCGGARLVRADVFQELNGFDTTFDPFGPEDLDFSLRLRDAGYLALYVPHAVAYHVVSHSYFKGYSEDYARQKTRHWFAFHAQARNVYPETGSLYDRGSLSDGKSRSSRR